MFNQKYYLYIWDIDSFIETGTHSYLNMNEKIQTLLAS